MGCFGGKRRSKSSLQDGNSMPPHDIETSSVDIQSASSLQLKGHELTNKEHEELTSLRTDVERLQTEQHIQLTTIKTKTDKIQEVETELAKVAAALEKECQIRRQVEAVLNGHKKAIEQIKKNHKLHSDNQLKKFEGERKALEEEKQDALLSLRRLNSNLTDPLNSKDCFQDAELMSPDNKESSPVHLKSTACNSFPNDLDESQGQKTTNIDNKNSTDLKTEVLRVQKLYQMQTETIAAIKNELANIQTELDTEYQTRGQLDTLINDRMNEIEELKNKLRQRKHQNAALKRDLKFLTDYKDKIDKQLQDQQQDLNEKERQIHKLKGDKKTLEDEKQEALRRLSAMMSVKLRDNNPNIADLSDQFRPTKLGEQFSELYDNEWTDAFDALQNVFEERHAISILLDIVLDSYHFCGTELQRVWQFANDWFVEENAPTTQQLSKTLKDSRKHNISRRVPDIEQKYTKYLSEICNNDGLSKLVTTDHLRKYISTCVRLSLLMTANDPPVLIECPDWKTFSERPYPDKPCSRGTSAESKDNDDSNNEQSAVAGNKLLNIPIICPNDAIEKVDIGHTVNPNLPQEKDGAMNDTSDDTHTAQIGDCTAVADLPAEQTTSPLSDTTPIVDLYAITIGFPNKDNEQVVKDEEINYEQTPAVTSGMNTKLTSKSQGTPNTSSDSEPELEAKESITQVAITNPDDNIDLQGNMNLEGKEKDQNNSSSTTAEQETNAVQITQIVHERKSFDKDKFKEYTSRGPFVDYFVWPIMYLHRGGPMLGKGIAQGYREKMEDVSSEPFVWWKRLSTSQM